MIRPPLHRTTRAVVLLLAAPGSTVAADPAPGAVATASTAVSRSVIFSYVLVTGG